VKYIKDILEGDRIVDHYLCRQKQIQKTRSGKNYLSLKLQDKTGAAEAKVWEMNHDIKDFEENSIVKIDAIAVIYQNELQIKISKLRPSMEGEYEPADYIRCTEKDIPAMHAQLLKLIDSIETGCIKKLTACIIKSEAVSAALLTHSAARFMHHGYLGGLLEHTLSVAQTCDFLAGRYKHVNRDILISTAVLHDIGKIFELSPLPINEYTDDGQLLGHIIIGADLVTAEAAKIEKFPHQLLSLIKHSILSHHGELEFGSPKQPYTIEAFLLHSADNMDAKAKAFEETVSGMTAPGPWAGYHKTLARYVRSSQHE